LSVSTYPDTPVVVVDVAAVAVEKEKRYMSHSQYILVGLREKKPQRK
jgi:hypothetical protein